MRREKWLNVTRKIKRENVSIAQIWLVLIHLFFVMHAKKLTHGHCAKVSKEQIELLEQIEGAMWFCDKCRCYAKRGIQKGLTEFKAEVDQKVTVVKDLVKQTIAKHDETTEKLAEVVHEAVKTTAKQIEKAQTNTSGASYARAVGQTSHTLETGSQKYITPQRNPEHIFIASNTFNFKDSVEIKKEFAKQFPLEKLIHAFNTTRGNVHLEFVSKRRRTKFSRSGNRSFLLIQQRLEELFQRRSQIVLSLSRRFH